MTTTSIPGPLPLSDEEEAWLLAALGLGDSDYMCRPPDGQIFYRKLACRKRQEFWPGFEKPWTLTKAGRVEAERIRRSHRGIGAFLRERERETIKTLWPTPPVFENPPPPQTVVVACYPEREYLPAFVTAECYPESTDVYGTVYHDRVYNSVYVWWRDRWCKIDGDIWDDMGQSFDSIEFQEQAGTLRVEFDECLPPF